MKKRAPEHETRETGGGPLKTAVLIVLPVIVFFLLLEGGARVYEVFNPPIRVDLGQGFGDESRLFLPRAIPPGALGTNPDKTVSFQDQSFPRVKPEGTLRIFMLGGSSVNYLQHELQELAKRLPSELNDYNAVEIINCGGLSYGSHRLVLIAKEVLQYDPDLILLYSGHNEFEELEQLSLANLDTVPVQQALGNSALYRVMRNMAAQKQIADLEADSAERKLANALPDSARAWGYSFTREDLRDRMETYRNNLTRIAELCKNFGVPLIVGTVPSNLMKPALQGSAGAAYEQQVLPLFQRGDYETGKRKAQELLMQAPRHQSSKAENDVIRAVAQANNVTLADVYAAVEAAEPHHVPGETLFSDHCHLNGAGNKILAATFENEIVAILN